MSGGPRAEIPITFGDKTLICPRMGLHQLVELEQWMRQSAFQLFVKTMFDMDLPAELQQQAKAEAWDRAHAMLLLSQAGRGFVVNSVEATIRTIWISARGHGGNSSIFHNGKPNSQLRYEDVLGWLPIRTVLRGDLVDTVLEIIGFYEPENPTEPALLTAGSN